MVDIFINSTNLVPHAILTLAPPSSYALNLKALIKVSKVSWRSQLSYEILRSSFERKVDKTNFVSPQKLIPSHLGLRELTIHLSDNLITFSDIYLPYSYFLSQGRDFGLIIRIESWTHKTYLFLTPYAFSPISVFDFSVWCLTLVKIM